MSGKKHGLVYCGTFIAFVLLCAAAQLICPASFLVQVLCTLILLVVGTLCVVYFLRGEGRLRF